jgi:polysaccharide pyruvyl transferase WcaK-like protein
MREREANHKARSASPASVKASSNDILLCGWYGTETLGDKAILAGLLMALRRTGWNGSVDLASLEPYVSRQTLREMPELGLRKIESVARAREDVARGAYRAVCIAGGPLMSPVAEVYDLLGLFTEAAAAGSKRAILGCGIGPLGTSRTRDEAIAQLLTLSNTTMLRDSASLDLARSKLRFTGNAMVSDDPAFIWCQHRLTDAVDQGTRNGPILLALRDWQVQEYGATLPARAANEIKRHFESELVVMVDELHRLVPDWKLKPVAMHTHACGGDDRMFFQRLLADRPHLLSEISWRRQSPACMFKEFRTARAAVAMRFHSLVLSVAAGTPHVAIDYTRGGKIAGLISRIPGERPAFAIDNFSGKACAESVIAATLDPVPAAPAGIEEAYTDAWKQLLASAP